jgi:hypothetical protein
MNKMILCLLVLLPSLGLANDGFFLNPGERVVSIDGVPVASQGTCANGVCTPPVVFQEVSPRIVPPVLPSVRGRNGYPPVIGEGTAAYQHALREAQIIASRGGRYYSYSDGGHPLGNAPGARYSGTGYTWDMNRPGHCWEDELPQSRIIARARARGANGAWFWSAHYR